ncbi:MAG TPA: hypothetical protein VFC63_13285 [Blastocatellia bacterium]|nr:hypothetical protein [Blastocatellia bacterium]
MERKQSTPILVKRARDFLDQSLAKERLASGAVTTPARLEIKLKITQLPLSPIEDENGWKQFTLKVECDFEIAVRIRPRIWTKLETAARSGTNWVGVISGSIGERTPKGFSLTGVGVQIYEKESANGKPKSDEPKDEDNLV